MSTLTIVIICVALIALSGGLIVFTQAREKARLERARKMTALEDSHSRMMRILDEVPPQCLNQELRVLVIDRAIEICDELEALGTRLNTTDMRTADQQRRNTIINSESDTAARPVRIDSPEKANNARGLLEALFRFVESRHKAGMMESSQTRRFLQEILFQVYRVKADFLAFQAKVNEQRNEFRKAIRCLNLACDELSKSKKNPLAARMISKYRERIQSLDERASGKKKEMTEAKEKKIDREWDQFLAQEEGWKKKADYDD